MWCNSMIPLNCLCTLLYPLPHFILSHGTPPVSHDVALSDGSVTRNNVLILKYVF
uniref:Uncharacterized protein n=1 Tax=Arundo donax TaxID=35708 RepID=A0A0A9GTH0_ARUDO